MCVCVCVCIWQCLRGRMAFSINNAGYMYKPNGYQYKIRKCPQCLPYNTHNNKFQRNCKIGNKIIKLFKEFPDGLAVRDSIRSLLWLLLNLWPGIFLIPWAWPKNNNKKTFKKMLIFFIVVDSQ